MEAIKYNPNVEIVSNPESFARRGVEIFIADAKKAIGLKNTFNVAISGGRSPRHFFELLGTLPQSKALKWNRIQLFWVDERYVPPSSPQSNYKLAVDTFLSKVPVPQDNVHRIPTDYGDYNSAARQYEHVIRSVFDLEKNQLPEFDLIVLGMGSDGHTGSLFPNSYASYDTNDLACVVYVLDEKLNRITLTHPVLNAASHLMVLVCGREKAGILKKVLSSEPDDVLYPIHTLWPVLDKVTWLVDSEAAEAL